MNFFIYRTFRGISVLLPIAKEFEKILAIQVTIYLNLNEVFFLGQHGFKRDPSYKTSLHEIFHVLMKTFIINLITRH